VAQATLRDVETAARAMGLQIQVLDAGAILAPLRQQSLSDRLAYRSD
jgi:hypothetical protein